MVDICMFVHNGVPGDSRVIKEASSLTAHGWSVVVIGLVIEGQDLATEQELLGFKIIHIMPKLLRKRLPGTLGKLIRMAVGIPAAAYQLRKANARVYHANNFTGLVLMTLAGIWSRPVVYDSHELFFDRWTPSSRYPLKRLFGLLRPVEKWLASKAAAVLTASYESAELMKQTMSIPEPVAILNAVDLRKMQPSVSDFPTNGRKALVHSGFFTVNRHLDELVESLAYLPDDITVVLMGTGFLQDHLVQLAAAKGVSERLIIVPPVPPMSVSNTMAQADAGIILFSPETLHGDTAMPNKFFEAVAAGLPLVCGKTTALEAAVKEYDLGVMCDSQNPRSIANAVIQVLDDANNRRYRANALKAQAVLNWETEERKLIGVYEKLLSRS